MANMLAVMEGVRAHREAVESIERSAARISEAGSLFHEFEKSALALREAAGLGPSLVSEWIEAARERALEIQRITEGAALRALSI
jgi:hypothetical protein